MKYIKRAIAVEAIQFTGTNRNDIEQFTERDSIMYSVIEHGVRHNGFTDLEKLYFDGRYIMPNNWIVKENEEFIIVENEYFRNYYECAD